MYIRPTERYYTSDGQQAIRRQLFLMLVQPKDDSSEPIRAIVRKVAMRQFGHWMMGYARVEGHSLTLSGSYGEDGLVMNVPQEVYDLAIELPKELYDAWNKGGGWNSCGSEAPLMAKWANENLSRLYGGKP